MFVLTGVPRVQENVPGENELDLTPPFSYFKKKRPTGFSLCFLNLRKRPTDRFLGVSNELRKREPTGFCLTLEEKMRKRRGFESRPVFFGATTAMDFPTQIGRKSYLYMCMYGRCRGERRHGSVA